MNSSAIGSLDAAPGGLETAMHGPILLFDGVCNLCHSSVQFVLDRDRDGRFRFASLQSTAARELLDEADVPTGTAEDLNSVVLLDAAGVHTQSTAALRSLQHLGWPWRLLTIALLIPASLRDAVYRWIAQNRYQWFGRQATCRVPTPELRDRFLDADEEIAAPSAAPTPAAVETEERSPGSRLGAFLHRLALVYPVLYMAPFPLTLLYSLWQIPGFGDSFFATPIAYVVGLASEITQPVLSSMATWFTDEPLSFRMTGSGDGLAAYLDVLFDFGVALVIALLWWLVRRGRPVSARSADVARVLVRYFLASMMLSYGFSKIFPLQFPAPGPDRLMQPYGDSSPMGLLWTFMGASPPYQMFGGAAEALGGTLLLFRRTTLAGALVLIGVMTNVFALNMCYDVPVKLGSFHYLALAGWLAAPDVPRLLGLLFANLPVASRSFARPWGLSPFGRRALGVCKLVVLLWLFVPTIASKVQRMNAASGPGGTPHPLQGTYVVNSFSLVEPDDTADPEGTSPVAWVRVGFRPPYIASIQRSDGSVVRMRIQLDDDESTLSFFERGAPEPPETPLRYELEDDGQLRLLGPFHGSDLEVTLQREENEWLLLNRKFRWVTEYPFNR